MRSQSGIFTACKAVIKWVGEATIFSLEFIGKLFEEYKAARRLLLIWAVVVVTDTISKFWVNLSAFKTPENVVLGVIGLITLVFGFYQWSRERDQ